jgi:hypothetical protein
MMYICEDCGLLFFQEDDVKDYPFCEKSQLRIATIEELEKCAYFGGSEKQFCICREETREMKKRLVSILNAL